MNNSLRNVSARAATCIFVTVMIEALLPAAGRPWTTEALRIGGISLASFALASAMNRLFTGTWL